MENTTKSIAIGIVFIIGVFSSAAATYYFEEKEISSLTTEYKSENDLLSNSLESSFGQLEDWYDYDKLMVKGLSDYSEALANRGYVDSDYDDAGINYDAVTVGRESNWRSMFCDNSRTYYFYVKENTDTFHYKFTDSTANDTVWSSEPN